MRAGLKPDLSWDRAERKGRGRDSSSSEMGGAGIARTRLRGREAIEEATADVWRDWMVDL